jgi:hypothetical protein
MQLSKTQVNEIEQFKYELTIVLKENSNDEQVDEILTFYTKAKLYPYIIAEVSLDDSFYVLSIEKEVYVTKDIMMILSFIEMYTNYLDAYGDLLPNITLKMSLEQFDSFEQAYEVATMLQDENSLIKL